jgi:hypothetical protein
VVLSGTGDFSLSSNTIYQANTAIFAGGGYVGLNASGSGYGVYATSPDTGVSGNGYYGVYGNGNGGTSSIGVHGTSSGYGVYANGTVTGVFGTGLTGVSGFSSLGHGIKAESNGTGLDGAALYAKNSGGGIAAWADNNSGDATLVLTNAYSGGDLIKGFTGGGTSPVFRVDGTGKGFFNGGIALNGADLAELIPVLEPLEPGDVVEIDPGNSGFFRRCATAGSLAVAGVISTKPGMTLGGSDPAGVDNKGTQLALAGRIPVKVTDEGGSIQPGSLLIASSTPGHAMRAPSPAEQGSVLGKALGRLESGTGTVEMLVMLR